MKIVEKDKWMGVRNGKEGGMCTEAGEEGAERLRRNSDNFSNIAQYFAIEKAYTQGDRLLIKAIRS